MIEPTREALAGKVTLLAELSWWGDPAGPLGPKGDGVLGNVHAGNPLAAPVVLRYWATTLGFVGVHRAGGASASSWLAATMP